MKIVKRTTTNKIHQFSRRLAGDTARVYSYKLFRVRRADGLETTVAMDPLDYGVSLCESKLTAREYAQVVKGAAASVTLPLRRGFSFSAATRARTPAILKARRLGVSVEDLAHADANNAAWG